MSQKHLNPLKYIPVYSNRGLLIAAFFLYSLQLFSYPNEFWPGSTPDYPGISSPNAAPVFGSSSYLFQISESATLGSGVGITTATDGDGDAITYSIENGNTNRAFTINPNSGTISVAKHLNHHTQNQYRITVRATDVNSLFSEATVTINISGDNQIPPFTALIWGTAAKQPMNTHEVHGEVVNGKLYIFGGYNPNKTPAYIPTFRSFVYDPATDKWSTIADLPHTPKGTDFGGVTHEGLATDGTDVYLAGGYTSNSSGTGQVFGTKQVWRYNVVQNNYTALPFLPVELATGQLRYLKGRLHYIGGTNLARQDIGTHYVLDLDNIASGWKLLAPLSNPRNHGGSQVYEEKIYFIGGAHGQDDNSITQATAEAYNSDTDSWQQLADLPVPRDHISSAVVVMGNRILVLGGKRSHTTQLNLVSAYSPDNNTWENLTPLTDTKAAGVAAVLNGALYYTGGNFSNTNRKGTIIPGVVVQKVDSFTLLNADNGQPIKTIQNNDVINLLTLPSSNLNIRANTNPSTVGSVVFNLTGTKVSNVTENIAPYALFGDDKNGTYYSWTPAEGSYNLTATPYTSSGGGGSAGTSLSRSFSVINDQIQAYTLNPVADSYVRNGPYSDKNYGFDTSILVKGSPNSGFTRYSFLKFNLNNIPGTGTAKLRIFGQNIDNNTAINLSLFGVNDDSWMENGITFNNQPTSISPVLGTINVNNQATFYDFDVTDFINSEIAGDKISSFVIKDLSNKDKILSFNSRENSSNPPQLIILGPGAGADDVPPTVDVIFNGTLAGRNTYQDKVQITINSSDAGGSGLAYTRYSLNNGPYQDYTVPVLVDAPGTYTLSAIAADGNGNITQTNAVTFSVISQAAVTLLPISDASVRNGAYSDKNYGSDTFFLVKTSPNPGFTRVSYLKFSLANISGVSSAALRLYGNNTVDNGNITLSSYGVSSDSWSENMLTWNNAPVSQSSPLSTTSVNGQLKYYDFDVTGFVKSELAGDKIVSLAIKDVITADKILSFNSKENSQNKPQLVINSNGSTTNLIALGNSDSSGLENPKLYPNPLRDKFILKLPSSYEGHFNIKIADLSGKIYDKASKVINSGGANVEIDISKLNLPPGVYYLEIQSGRYKTDALKFVVQ